MKFTQQPALPDDLQHRNDPPLDYDKNEPVPNPIGEGKATSEIGDPGMPPFYRTMALFIGVVCGLMGLLAGVFLL